MQLVCVLDCADPHAGFRWVVMADPEGNEFCVLVPPAPHQTRPMSAVDMQ